MKMLRDDRGSVAVTTVLILPLLLVVLAGVMQLGALRVSAARVRAAADLATLVAVNDQDERELARTGMLRLAPDAAEVARAYLARNLELSAPLLARSSDEIAASADIVAYATAPAIDARTGSRYERPTVRIAASVPIRTPIFGGLIFSPVTSVDVLAASSPR
jgi:Flp pilus assembly protein TadG